MAPHSVISSTVAAARKASIEAPYQVLNNQFRVHVSVIVYNNRERVFIVAIPYPQAKVSYLAKNVAERYYMETGNKVSVRILGRTGDELCPQAVIEDVVGDGDQLSAEVSFIDESCFFCCAIL